MDPKDPGVLLLAPHDMARRISEPRPVLVLFYADWCGFCIRFLGPWRERVQRIEVETVAADISDWDDPRWDLHGIEAVPTLVLFADGKQIARLASPLGVGIAPAEVDAFLARVAA